MSTTCTLLLTTLVFLLPLPPLAGAARASLPRGAAIAVEDYATDFLVSPDGTFACGFYNVSPTVFSVSVWFARAAARTVVWTAAPARPVHSTGARLSLDRRAGALVLTDFDGTVVWNSTSVTGDTARARLLDTGNLVLEGGGNGAGEMVWQSFDSPTDTLLPGQRFTAARHLIYNFTREAELDVLGQFISSDDAGFVAADLAVTGVRRRLTLDADGDLRLYSLDAMTGTWTVTWMAFANPCTIHGVCGANAVCLYGPSPACVCAPGHERADAGDWTKGCLPAFRRDCSGKTKLVALPHTDFWGYDLNDGEILPFHECARRCHVTCACVAFQHKQNMECYLKSVLFNGRTFPGLPGTVYMKVPADFAMPDELLHVHQWRTHGGLAIDEEIPTCDSVADAELLLNVSAHDGGRDVGKAVWPYMYGFLSALLIVEAVVIAFGCWLFSSRGLFRPSRVWAIEEGYKLITNNFQRYTYSEIKRATNNFTDVIGSGGSGVVYKGVLEDDRVVAVKVLRNVLQSEQEFQSELSVIGRIYHMNLVRMWGCCSEGKHRILVSEHIENGLPITEKNDVYSYGVVLLELVKGVRISEWVIHGVKLADMDTRMVVKAIREKMETSDQERCVKDLMDHRLNGEFNHAQAKAMLKIAVSCLEEDRGKRPNMSSVLQALMSVEEEGR
ncbi:hypothetical protein HU200_019969 [Digitaria exilis]|uniref:non-specific serine/threonine protein kinase n=1 Tax=Digitaria exilis TaxID=1010633 RepID=A0A835F123_9POAL|nr:hypothetical protein HU200_019969 [Digitaria exilis]